MNVYLKIPGLWFRDFLVRDDFDDVVDNCLFVCKLHYPMKKQSISAAAFEDAFERGEDILPLVDLSKAMRPGLKTRQLSVDFPSWMFDALKELAARRGISYEQLILAYIADRLGAVGG